MIQKLINSNFLQMITILFVFFSFITLFLFQLLIWRIVLPKNHSRAIILIFVFVYFSALILAKQLSIVPALFFSQFTILFFLTFLSYLISYSAIEAVSPTILILLVIDREKEEGITLKEILHKINNDYLVNPRIQDLFKEKLIEKQGDYLTLTLKGDFFISIFLFFRKLLKLRRGG